jgi:hypothetical protein
VWEATSLSYLMKNHKLESEISCLELGAVEDSVGDGSLNSIIREHTTRTIQKFDFSLRSD